VKVWLDSWQWQCCGDPFAVGSEVLWDVLPTPPQHKPYLSELLGPELAGTIDFREEHHEDPRFQPRLVPTRGRVESIAAVYCQRAPRAGEEPRELFVVPGTTVLEQRERADGWEPEGDGLRFEGYVVELTALE
jgi:hypothetical protein